MAQYLPSSTELVSFADVHWVFIKLSQWLKTTVLEWMHFPIVMRVTIKKFITSNFQCSQPNLIILC